MKILKILGINASPKGTESNTLKLVKGVLDGASAAGAKTELVDLYELDIKYCTACGTCYAKGECPLDDDFPDLFEKMMNADGIVLGSPNYIDSVSAPMKAFFDRMADAMHCQMLLGKYGCAVCTAGGTNLDEVMGYMNRVLTNLGATAVGSVGASVGRDPAELPRVVPKAIDLGKKLVESIQGRHRYPDQDEIHRQRKEHFCQLVKFNRAKWGHEYEWFIEMGWIKEGE